MGKIVAVSGVMKAEFSDAIVALAGVTRPNVLMIPTARYDDRDSYKEDVRWFTKRNCNVSHLHLFAECPSAGEIREKISNADIVYVSGGNTLKMMRVWRAKKVDHVLRQAYVKNIVLCGPSAGANCWFKKAISGPFPSDLVFELSLDFLSELDIEQPWPNPGKVISRRLRQAFHNRKIYLSETAKIYATLGFTGDRTGHLWQVFDESNNLTYWIRRKNKQLSVYIPDKFMKVSGLGLVNTIFAPHYAQRRDGIKNVMQKTRGAAIGLEDCCALVIVDDQYRILSTDDDKAYHVFWRRGVFHEVIIESRETWMPVSSLIKA